MKTWRSTLAAAFSTLAAAGLAMVACPPPHNPSPSASATR